MDIVVKPDFTDVSRVNEKLMERVNSIEAVLRGGVEKNDDLYPVLVEKLGKPTKTIFKIEFNAGKEMVVGGKMVFEGDDLCRYVAIDEVELTAWGKTMMFTGESHAINQNIL